MLNWDIDQVIAEGHILLSEPAQPSCPGWGFMQRLHKEHNIQNGGIRALRVADNEWMFFIRPSAVKGYVEEGFFPKSRQATKI